MILTDVKNEALRIFDICERDLIGDNRFVEMTRPRMALYKVYRDRGMSLTQIGRYLKRDHSTVLSGLRRIEVVMEQDPTYREQVEYLASFSANNLKL
jgi:chromosomal replication initiation ATPase DnaA